MKKVIIYTDGACSGNPGPGGWGAILTYGEKEKELSGCELETTNNRMELLAVISALEVLKEPCEVTIVSDSKYIVDAIKKGWLDSWKKNGWRKSDKKPVLNQGSWQKLIALMEVHSVTFEWVRGHDGHPYNERCDALATSMVRKLLES